MATQGYSALCYGNWTAGADLSGSQYRFVRQTTTAHQVQGGTTASGPIAVGVLQNDPKSGEAADVVVIGPTKVEVGGTIGVRDFITVNGSGQAVVTNLGSASVVYGFALEASTAQGQYIEVFLTPLTGGCAVDNTP